jgi:hypothetical protein
VLCLTRSLCWPAVLCVPNWYPNKINSTLFRRVFCRVVLPPAAATARALMQNPMFNLTKELVLPCKMCFFYERPVSAIRALNTHFAYRYTEQFFVILCRLPHLAAPCSRHSTRPDAEPYVQPATGAVQYGLLLLRDLCWSVVLVYQLSIPVY